MSAPSPSTGQPLVSPEAPWLGLRAFTEDLRGYFFGREREVDDLFERVAQKPLTVLFGQSGLGKTSLLQAALIPRLRHAGFLPVLLRLDHNEDAPSLEAQLMEALRVAVAPTVITLPAYGATAPLWLLLHDPACGLCQQGAPNVVLMLDQLEEIFTLGEASAGQRARSETFLHTLAEVVENRVPSALRDLLERDEELSDRLDYPARPLKLLISMREDFLHRLERWRPHLPSLMDNRFELRLLTGTQALAAVVEPGKLRCEGRPDLSPLVDTKTGAAIVRFVAGADGNVPLAEIDAVPPLLSLLCAELNAQRGESASIHADQLQGRAEDILAGFYERCFAPHPAAVRRFVEDRLLDPEGYRQAVTQDTFVFEMIRAGIRMADSLAVLARLVDDRLLVSEERGGIRRMELTHDTITGVARKSRDIRVAREKSERRRRQRQRLAGLVLGLAILISAVSIPLAVRAERARSLAESEKRRATAALAALEKAKLAAENGEQIADAEKARAITAKTVADELIKYMQYDLRELLAKHAQRKLTASIYERISRYHAALSAEAEVLREDSVTLDEQGELLQAEGQFADALRLFQGSMAIRARLLKQSPENADSQRDFSASCIHLGDVQSVRGERTEAVNNYQTSRAIIERLLLQDPENVEWQRDLSICCIRLGDALSSQENRAEALENYRTSIRINEHLANQDPGNMDSQYGLSLSYERVANIQSNQAEHVEALKSYRASLAIRERLAQEDPENARWQSDLVSCCERTGNTAMSAHCWQEANDVFGRQLELSRPRLTQPNAEVGWISSFSYAASRRWELMKNASADLGHTNREAALSDLQLGLSAILRVQKESGMASPLDQRLAWIQGLLGDAGEKPTESSQLPSAREAKPPRRR